MAISNIGSTIMSLAKSFIKITDDPIPGFFFEVQMMDSQSSKIGQTVSSLIGLGSPSNSASFTEVQGLNIGADEPESKIEVGMNIPITLPKALRTDKLTLKRYLRPKHSVSPKDAFTKWCEDSFDIYQNWNKSLPVKNIMVKILHPHIKGTGSSYVPVATFLAERCFPINWEISDLNSTNAEEPIVETITLAYQRLLRGDQVNLPSDK